jgi:hypothetical protein
MYENMLLLLCLFFLSSSIEIGVTLCVVASSILGFFMNPIIDVTRQSMLLTKFHRFLKNCVGV